MDNMCIVQQLWSWG